MTSIRTFARLLFCLLAPASAEDLDERYPATRTWSQSGLATACEAGDVWSLKSFELSAGKDLQIKTGKATLCLGRDGTDVLWAVILPGSAPKLRVKLATEREQARSTRTAHTTSGPK